MTDLLAGNVQFMFNALPSMIQQVNAGRLRALGVTGSARSSQLPDVPPLRDSVPGYEVTTWYSFVAPAGTPRAAIDRLNKEISAIVTAPEMKKRLKGQGLETDALKPEGSPPTSAPGAKWAKAVRDAARGRVSKRERRPAPGAVGARPGLISTPRMFADRPDRPLRSSPCGPEGSRGEAIASSKFLASIR